MLILNEAQKVCRNYKKYNTAVHFGKKLSDEFETHNIQTRYLIGATTNGRYYVVFIGENAIIHNSIITSHDHAVAA